jgi:hypothetical protein
MENTTQQQNNLKEYDQEMVKRFLRLKDFSLERLFTIEFLFPQIFTAIGVAVLFLASGKINTFIYASVFSFFAMFIAIGIHFYYSRKLFLETYNNCIMAESLNELKREFMQDVNSNLSKIRGEDFGDNRDEKNEFMKLVQDVRSGVEEGKESIEARIKKISDSSRIIDELRGAVNYLLIFINSVYIAALIFFFIGFVFYPNTGNSESLFGNGIKDFGQASIKAGLILSGNGNGNDDDICELNNPEIVIDPQSQHISQSLKLSYNLTIENNDSLECDSSVFNIDSNIPEGFTASPASFDLTLGPGESKTQTIKITAPENVASGDYTFMYSATNVDDTDYFSFAEGMYLVDANYNKVLNINIIGSQGGYIVVSEIGKEEKKYCYGSDGSCKFEYSPGTKIALNGVAYDDSFFEGFTGDCKEIDCSFVMEKDVNVSAEFNSMYTLMINRDGDGHGVAQISVKGQKDDVAWLYYQNRERKFLSGTYITLKAIRSFTSKFEKWTGCDSTIDTDGDGRYETCYLTMPTYDKTVRVKFNPHTSK